MVLLQNDKEQKNISEIKLLHCIQNDVVVNFKDAKRIVHCAKKLNRHNLSTI